MRLGEETVDVFLYADDMVLLAEGAESLHDNLKELNKMLTKWEMN